MDINPKIAEWNATDTEIGYKENINILLHKAALKYSDRPAASDERGTITYAQLDAYSNAVCNLLLKEKDKTGNGYISILIGGRIERLCFITGILKAGMTYVPMDVKAPLNRNRQIYENISGSYILTDEIYHEDALKIAEVNNTDSGNIKALDISQLAKMDCSYTEVVKPLDRDAYIIHTSGSTGKPKGVRIPDSALNNFCWSITHGVTEITPEDRTCALQNFSFDYSLMDMFPFMLSGACIYFVPDEIKSDISKLNDFLIEKGITQQAMTTALYHMYIDYDNPVLKKIFVCGEKMVGFVPKSYDIYNLYGPTEATVIVSCYKVTEKKENIPIGGPIFNTKLIVIREDGTVADLNEKGELCILGDNLANGYLNNEEETKKRFVPSVLDPSKLMYKTGDIGEWRENGDLLCYGRMDFQIKHRGYRIELDEINGYVFALDNISKSIVLYNDRHENKYIVCFYCTNDGKDISQADFNSMLEDKLPEYMMPAKWVHMDSLPLNNNGKVDRNALFEILEKEHDENIASGTDDTVEGKIRLLWAELLDIKPDFNADSNFRSLGGHSILSFLMLKRLKELIGVEVAFKEFLKADTLNKLCNLIGLKLSEGRKEFTSELITDIEHRYEPFQLNPIQQSYYYGRVSSRLGNVPTAVYMEFRAEKLDTARLEKALNELVARHEMLRCVICGDNEQRILKDPPHISLDVTDRTDAVNESETAEIVNKACEEIFCDFIDLKVFPSFKFKVIKFSEADYRILTIVDCTFIDGASIGIIIRDLYALYKERELEPITISFRDYQAALDKETASYKEGLKYWMNRIDTLPDAPPLPVLRENGFGKKCCTVRREAFISPEIWNELKKTASSNNLSLFMIQITIFSIIMARWSGKKHFTINVPIFNRFLYDEQVMKLAGEFGSLIFLEVDLDEDKGFIYNCKKISEQFENDMANRVVNGVDVMNEYKAKGRNLNVPVVFTSLTTPSGKDGIYNDETNLLRWKTHSSQVWLDSIVFDKKGGIEIGWDCYGGVFDDDLLDDMFKAYAECFDKAVNDKYFIENSIKNAVNGRNYESVLRVNETEYKYDCSPKLLHEGFLESFRNTPEKPACADKVRSYSYAEIYNAASSIAEEIIRSGGVKGSNIAVTMKKSWKQIAASLGILMIGGTFIPVSPEWPEDRVASVFENADVKIIVTDEERFENADVKRVYARDEQLAYKTDFVPDMNIDENSPAYIIYTSGSTGTPKGVVIGHSSAVNTILAVNRRNGICSDDRSIMLSEAYFDLSIYDIFGLFYAGGSVYIPDAGQKADPLCWKDILVGGGITVWNTVPALMQMLTDINGDNYIDGAAVRNVFLSGDWIPLNLPEKIRKTLGNVNIVSMGGATEASIWSNYYNVDKVGAEWRSIPYGYPLDNQKMFVLNDDLKICPENVPGDIYIGGEGLAIEYLGDEKLTNEKFIYCSELGMRLYNTGDRGAYINGNCIEFLGRKDNQIKLNGYRIELGEIEAAALSDERINAAVAVFDKPKSRINLYYVAHTEIDEDEFRNELYEKLPVYMRPSGIMKVNSFAVTPNGKIEKKQLPTIADDLTVQDYEMSSDEKELADIYCSVIGIDRIGANEDFFRCGGDSVKAIKLIYRISAGLNVHIDLSDIFNYPSVRLMNEYIRGKGEDEHSVRHETVSEHMELSLSQKGIWFSTRNSEISTGDKTFILAGSVKADALSYDHKKLEEAVNMVIEDNIDLRTCVYEEAYIPYRKYLDHRYIPVEYIKSGMDTEQTTDMLEEKVIKLVSENDHPLMAAFAAGETNDGNIVISTAVHHMIADAFSINIMMKRISDYYLALLSGNAPERIVPEYSFGDFSAYQYDRLSTGGYDEDIEYWKEKLSNIRAMNLSEKDRSAVSDNSSKKVTLDLTCDEMEAFRQICADSRCSLYSGISAVMSMVMRYYFRVDDISMGLGYALRTQPEFMDVIGSFAVSTLLRVSVSGSDTVEDTLRKTDKCLKETINHSNLPFNVYVEKAGADLKYADLPYNVTVDCVETDDDSNAGAFSKFNYSQKTIPADLMLMVEPHKKDSPVYMLYKTELFDEDAVEEYAGVFRDILRAILVKRSITVDEIETIIDEQ